MYLSAELPLQTLEERPIFVWFLTRFSNLLFVLLSGRVRPDTRVSRLSLQVNEQRLRQAVHCQLPFGLYLENE